MVLCKEQQNTTMRILFCVDTDQYLETLGSRLSKVLNLFTDEIYYLDVLHVYQKPKADAPHMPATMLDIQKDEEILRMQFLADCQHKISNVLEKKLKKAALVNSHLIQGKFFKELKDHVKYHKYDLIVLLPGKKDAVQLLLKGRNVMKIVSNIDVPILILPKESAFEFRQTVFIGMLEKPKKQLKKFKKNRVLRQVKEASLKYLHICDDHSDYEEIEVLNHSSRVTAFKKFHEQRKSNYIYIMNHKAQKKSMRKWRKSSFTKTILAKSNASVMVI